MGAIASVTLEGTLPIITSTWAREINSCTAETPKSGDGPVALQARQVVDEQHAVQMVHLMLDAGGTDPRRPPRPACHDSPGSAAAPGPAARPRRRCPAPTGSPPRRGRSLPNAQRISGLTKKRGCAVLVAAGEVHDDDPLGHADLDGRQADAGRGVHGLQHVVHQRAQVVVDRRHRLGYLLQVAGRCRPSGCRRTAHAAEVGQPRFPASRSDASPSRPPPPPVWSGRAPPSPAAPSSAISLALVVDGRSSNRRAWVSTWLSSEPTNAL